MHLKLLAALKLSVYDFAFLLNGASYGVLHPNLLRFS